MAKMEKRQRRRVRNCIGDLSELIYLESRQLQAPKSSWPSDTVDNVDSNFVFAPWSGATGNPGYRGFTGLPLSTEVQVWANVETVSGVTLFDSVSGLERNVSHNVIIRWIEGMSSEIWLRLNNGQRLDILATSNLDERTAFIEITAALSGLNTQAASGL